MSRRELVALCLVLAAIEGVLWWRMLPLPHGDFAAHVEPAWWFAQDGTIKAPGSQYKDLTYRQSAWFYPPGQFVILGGWIRTFGWSDDSLLGYTHLIHAAWLVALWVLLRTRFACGIGTCAIALAAVFPVYHHGRPDLLAALFTVCAYLAADRWAWLTGVFLAAALLVSPGFGLAAVASAGILLLHADRWRSLAIALASAAIAVCAAIAILLPDAAAREFALQQFQSNAVLRGTTLNQMPSLVIPYAIIYCTIPLGMALALAVIEIARRGGETLRIAAWTFAAGFVAWFLTNKAQLLYMHHFLLPAKAVFLAALAARRPRMGTPVLVLTAAIAFYWAKADFVYIAQPLREQAAAARAAHPRGPESAAIDGLHMTTHYREADTVLHEVMFENSWREFRDRGLPPVGGDGVPITPAKRYISSLALYRFPEKQASLPAPLRLFGRAIQLPAEPFTLHVLP